MTTQNNSPSPPVAGLILAAGSASRMQQPKQLLDWHGRALVHVVAEYALDAGLAPVLVVTGAAQQQVEMALVDLPIQFVHNPDYVKGQSSSLHAGVTALPDSTAAVLILLGDQPFVSAAVMRRIVQHWQAGAGPIIAPVYAGQRGNPVLFERIVFPELLTVSGDQGARQILMLQPERVAYVYFDDARPLMDIDTPQEYAHALEVSS